MDITLQNPVVAVPSYIFAALALLMFASKLLGSVDPALLSRLLDRKHHQTQRLKELAADQTLSRTLQLALQEKRERLIFEEQYGISTHREMREAMFHLSREFPHRATWQHLRRAYNYSYIDLVGDRLTIKMQGAKPRTAINCGIWLPAIAVALLGLTCVVVGAFFSTDAPHTSPLLIYSGEFLLVFVWLWLSAVWWWPRQSAKLIESCLRNDKRKDPLRPDQQDHGS